MTSENPVKTSSCQTCGRAFADANALFQHTKKKHGVVAARRIRRATAVSPGDEQSLAYELVEAIEGAYEGQPVPGYLWNMFSDQFTRGASPDSKSNKFRK